MSDKASDKRYKITLTEKQLDLIGKAVKIMLRTGRGQMYDLAEWIVLSGCDTPSGAEFDIYIAERNLVQSVLEGMVRNMGRCPHVKGESNPIRELTTLYEAIGHKQWEDSGEPEWDVRSHEPIKCGKEPIPEIGRVDE